MINTIYQIIRTSRPRQWLKNLSLLAAPIFAGRFFVDESILSSIQAFIIFCAVSSGGYFINDLVDASKDRAHPIKKNRPIASGKLSPMLAWIVAASLILGAILYSSLFMNTFFTFSVIAYILIQFTYSFLVRNIIILDSLIVAGLFVVRVFAGAFASNSSLSSWLILATIGLSLLLAFGKRRSEKTIIKNLVPLDQQDKTRATLRHYPDSLLDSMISMSSTFAIISYSLFTFQSSPETQTKFTEILPSIIRTPKLMMLTIPIVIYGVARYLYVIYEKQDAESPERVLLKDKPLFLAVALWGIVVFVLLYLLPIVL